MKNIFDFKKFKLNEESQRPDWIGTNYNEINVLYQLTKDDFTFVPSKMKYWDINTRKCMLWNKKVSFRDEEDFQRQIANKDWFFILYNDKMYIYFKQYKSLYDAHENRVTQKDKDPVFNQQMNELIHKTLNPSKEMEIF